jgi:hypothetical protein
MLNVSEIRTKLFGVVGLRQPYNPDYDILESTITASSSGQYFDQFSSYITVENIKDTQPYADISDADFNLWLTDKIKDSIVKGLQQCFNDEDLIENMLLFDNSIRKVTADQIANDGDFVGYEIDVAKSKDIKAVINKIITEFSGSGNVKILLFNDNLDSLLQSDTVTINSTNVQTVVDWDLVYANSVAGGKFYVGYLTTGLIPLAYNRNYNDANHQNTFSMMGIQPIKVAGWNAETLFDIDDVEYVSETFGLNFDLSSYRDWTSLAVNNKDKFAEVIGYQFAVDIIGMMYSSIRTNSTERLQKGNLLIELQGGFINDELPVIIGVQAKLKKAIEEIKKTFVKPDVIRTETLQ